MRRLIYGYLVVVLVVLLWWYFCVLESEFYNVKTSSGGEYLLRREYKDELTDLESAKKLEKLNENNMRLINYLKENHGGIWWVRYLVENYKKENLREGSRKNGLTSYLINKKELNMCIRGEGTENFNTLMYVDLHELAHMCNYDRRGVGIEGHGVEFIEKFKFLVNTAIKLGLYKKVNYMGENYCGLRLNSSVV